MASVVPSCNEVCEVVSSPSLHEDSSRPWKTPRIQGVTGHFLREVLFDFIPCIFLLGGSMMPNKLEGSEGL